MASISVNEDARKKKRKPEANLRPERDKRKKRYDEGKEILDNREKEGTPRNVVFARIQVGLGNSNPALLADRCECGHVGWKWQDECSRCGKPVA